MTDATLRIGIDLGGTKIAAVALSEDDKVLYDDRKPTPREDYPGTIRSIVDIVSGIESSLGAKGTVGIGIPGSISPHTGLVQNANSTWLNGHPFEADLAHALARDVRLANDANCFALSEAYDGAASGARTVFGVILGTGCGGGIVVDGRLHEGSQRIGGEWGHTPLPWPEGDETPGPLCWCGRRGCLETWISGPGLASDHENRTGRSFSAQDVASAALDGDEDARSSLERHADRLARGLAAVMNILDPDVIVVGGGLSKLSHLYDDLPARMTPFIFSDSPHARIVPPRHGDASGVRGAARLW